MSITVLPRKLTGEVKTFIMQAIYETLGDPDFGLELSEGAKKRLRKAKTRLSRQKTVPFLEIKKRYL